MSQYYKNSELTKDQIKSLGERLKAGEIGVFLSDTIYGIFTSALKQDSVEKIYELRKRAANKPMIILLPSVFSLDEFWITVGSGVTNFLNSIWPGPVSVVLPCQGDEYTYLNRGSKSLAFRIPDDSFLQQILKYSGPLVAPSANVEGETPSQNIEQAKKYFGNKVDFYVDGGEVRDRKPSTLIKIEHGVIETLRQGEVSITQHKL